jgi:REP element-mobilizing transposase RayT
MLQINDVTDHVHLLIGLKPDMALSDLVREIKASSSKFINGQRWIRGKFHWQEGFGAFSYGHSQLDQVIQYIRNQEKHHQQHSFKHEYLTLLRKFDIAFEDKYVFDFIEDEPTEE